MTILLQGLVSLGYQRVSLVEDRGSFAVRGDLVDLFPPMLDQPVRLAFFGDELEELRSFDPVSQRSGDQHLVRLELAPAREMILAGSHLETFTRRCKERCDDLEIPRAQREAILDDVREGLLGPGRENLLPLNYESLDTLFDYLGRYCWVMLDPAAIMTAADEFSEAIQQRRKTSPEQLRTFCAGAGVLSFRTGAGNYALTRGRVSTWPPCRSTSLRRNTLFIAFRFSSNTDLRPDHASHDGSLAPLVERLQGWLD